MSTASIPSNAQISDNEQRVLLFFATLSDGNLEKLRGMLHPNAVWAPQIRAGVPGVGAHRGRDRIIDEFLAPVRGIFEPGDPKIFVDTLVGRGDVLMAETRGVGTLKSGKSYENYYAWAIEMKDGMLFQLREYMDGLYIKSLIDAA